MWALAKEIKLFRTPTFKTGNVVFSYELCPWNLCSHNYMIRPRTASTLQ